MDGYFSDLVSQSIERTKESTLGVLGINRPGLRAHLEERMRQTPGDPESPLATPLFEHTFGWRTGEKRLDELAGSLLHEDVLRVLTEAEDAEYRFDSGLKPYRHQIETWRTLLADEPRSVVVTTGTGSGKTECFMVPILDDLVRAQRSADKSLVGIRALFLYPLNALINSQRERLDAWTRSFGERIRFCLYNGMTEELASTVRKEQAKKPNQVLSRELLRRSPPPILMTNATMLEYMLVRQRDEPIVAQSREARSLRWIVLDEAHTYVGSQAAELSLLLRRVIEAFGARAENIRFVATSATLSGPDAEKDLQRYLAKLAGIPEERVVVIGGQRQVPRVDRPARPAALALADVTSIEPERARSNPRYEALCRSDVALALRDALTTGPAPSRLQELVEGVSGLTALRDASAPGAEVLAWLDVMTGTAREDDGTPFVKLRVHLFQRMLHGLWSCVEPSCADKPDHLDDWPFGRVFVVQRVRCTCGSPVLEAGFCNDCTEPHLVGDDDAGELRQSSSQVDDEFSLMSDTGGEEDEGVDEESADEGAPAERLILGTASDGESYHPVTLDLESAELAALDPVRGIQVHVARRDGAPCAACGAESRESRTLLRKAYLGAPFYISNAVPTVLEHCPDATKSEIGNVSAVELPANGRRLITFSDSRQGTARLAVRMQQEAERSRLRGVVFRTLRNAEFARTVSDDEGSTKNEAKLLEQIQTLQANGLVEMAQEKHAELEKLRRADQAAFGAEMSWDDLVRHLSDEPDMEGAILDYNRYANPDMFGGQNATAGNVVRLLLAREYTRRPKLQNSTETLGLVRVGYRGLESVNRCPRLWEDTPVSAVHGRADRLTLQDWKDFLKVVLDFYVRENTFVPMSREQQRWMGSKFAPKTLLQFDSRAETSSRVQRWPLASTRPRTRPVRLLAQGTELDLEDGAARDSIDVWLREAWTTFCEKKILSERDGRRALETGTLTFSLPRRAWVCPITHRLIDTTFRGLTPYLPMRPTGVKLACNRLELPDYASLEPASDAADPLRSVRDRVGADDQVLAMRAQGLWTDLSDRVVEGGFYYRTAEHSAQQSAKRLQDFERKFKQGRVNVLNCSTTMEMGVDIGGVSAVVMNNVPPHPANYLQRAGRAGRRNEPRAIAYTMCRNDPHDQRAFADPRWPFVTPIRSPDISLDSASLVQRHVHSFLLAAFLRSRDSGGADNLKLTVQWFYGGEPSMAAEFLGWLGESEAQIGEPLRRLVRGTGLEDATFDALVVPARTGIDEIGRRWARERERLVALLEANERTPYGKALEKELARHEREYLLRDLAVRGFLPSYGFPTDVVSLKTYNIEDYRNQAVPRSRDDDGREDNIYRYKEQPSRGMAVALREYAPGAQIVVDGRVYRSAGVSLHWQTPGTKNEEQKFDLFWRCRRCGAVEVRENAYANERPDCRECGSPVPGNEITTVLQPAGFVTDFYEPTTNDVSSQTFVQVERPVIWVHADESPLPDARCGFLRFGHDGHVFVHSAGQHGTGYAVCLRCGRAESMTSNGDVPSALAPDKTHRPVGGNGGSKEREDCSGQTVKPGLFLGYRAGTDVLELALKNPRSGQWLDVSESSKTIANTLALALRESIAGRLGVASAEMGYAYRLDKDRETGQKRAIVQVHDAAAGGAGFVLTAADDMAGLLEECVTRLDCPRDCDSVCPACLAAGDGRVERDTLNRREARRWLIESGILEHLQLPERLRGIDGATAWGHSPRRFLDEAMSHRDRRLCLPIGESDLSAWSFDAPEIRYLAAAAKTRSDSSLVLVLPPAPDLSTDQLDQLRVLTRIGVELRMRSGDEVVPAGVRLRLQVQGEAEACRSLVSIGGRDVLEETEWLERATDETLASTGSLPCVSSEPFDPGEPVVVPDAEVVEFTKALNGAVRGLPNRFLSLLGERSPGLHAALSTDPVVAVEYSDRYLSSPWTVILLASLIEGLPASDARTLRLTTSLDPKHGRRPSMVFHDWRTERTLKDAVGGFFDGRLGIEPMIDVKRKNDVAHRRLLRLSLTSGQVFVLSFDQGMGYWKVDGPRPDQEFDFGASPIQQAKAMEAAAARLSMVNLGSAPSDLSIQRA